MGDILEFNMDCFEFDEEDLELLDFDIPTTRQSENSSETSQELPAQQTTNQSFPEEVALQCDQKSAFKKVVKVGLKAVGMKLINNKTSKAIKKGQAPEAASHPSPPKIPLIAFPQFDKCDSLIYFPHSYSRHLNCGDVRATSALLNTHADKDCQVKCVCGSEMYVYPLKNLRTVLDVSNDLGPDRIMCVHTTKVVDNQIRSVIYMKLTDSQSLHAAICAHTEDPVYQQLLKRSNRFSQFLGQPGLDEEVKQEVQQYAQAEEDVLLYMRMDFVLTFDERTRRITCIESDVQLTSIHPAPSVSYSKQTLV